MWLLKDSQVLGSVESAKSFICRAKGLIGKLSYTGIFWIPNTRWIHSFGMKFTIEVVYCDKNFTVVAMETLSPNRLGVPRRHAKHVFESNVGFFTRKLVSVGDTLTLVESIDAKR